MKSSRLFGSSSYDFSLNQIGSEQVLGISAMTRPKAEALRGLKAAVGSRPMAQSDELRHLRHVHLTTESLRYTGQLYPCQLKRSRLVEI